jgi:hypothetical protein
VVDGPDAAGGAAAEVPMFGHAREAAPRSRRGDPA